MSLAFRPRTGSALPVWEARLVIEATIRRAGANDAPALAQLRLNFKREDRDDAPPVPEVDFVAAVDEWLRERIENGSWLVWVAEVGGRVCGHVFLHPVEKVPSPYPSSTIWGYVTNFYVAPLFRGQGLGRRLLDALRAHACVERYDTLVVWPSERSTPLYQLAGFAPANELLEHPIDEAS